MSLTKCVASLVFTVAFVAGVGAARAETVNCTAVTSLPAVILAEGVYCLTGNLTTAMTVGNAIEIQASNVVLDLNGFKLGGGLAGTGTLAQGVHALNRWNITIRNGTVRGFYQGVVLENAGTSQAHLIEGIRADRNTVSGIVVFGPGSILRNNQVVTTGGATGFGPNVDAVGIYAGGQGVRVLNNDVMTTTAQGTGTSWGIRFDSTAIGGLAVNNRITEADGGIEYRAGATGKYRDTVTFDVTTGYSGGTDIGNNF